MQEIPKITKNTTIGEAIKMCPQAAFVLLDYGLHCVGCPMAQPETIEEAANLHQIDLKDFLKQLNKACISSKKKNKNEKNEIFSIDERV